MLRVRITTAVAIALIFFSSLFFLPEPGFIFFVSLVMGAGIWEWSNLSGLKNNQQRLLYCFLTLLIILCLASYVGLVSSDFLLAQPDQVAIRNLLLLSGIWWAIALLWVQSYPSSAILWGQVWMRAAIGWFVLIPAWFAFVYLYLHDLGRWLVVLMLFTVIVTDTGAYFFGRAFGRHKLAAEISPGKSWEGFWGGLFCCALLAFAVASLTGFDHGVVLVPILMFTALASVLGDLLESMVKRHRGIKDSSHLLPGHGGVMDRLDSITAAAPIFVLGFILSGWKL